MTFNTKGLMSSNRVDWKTPKAVYESLNKIFNFDFDPCPTEPTFDGLKISWGESNYMNPPYGGEIKKWIKKGYEESLKGKKVIMLIPSRTDTKYWHDYVMKANELWFIKGRLKFDDTNNSAPFPSVIVVFLGYKSDLFDYPLIKSVNINMGEC
jgi:site-specific DNA-methyltransferase (adenine-specific)